MLVFSDLSLRRGKKTLLADATFTIPPGQKVGITGANGVGKSSLFSLILGEIEADHGNHSMPMDWVIAHVAQHTPGGDMPALDYVLQGDREYVELKQKISTEKAPTSIAGNLLISLLNLSQRFCFGTGALQGRVTGRQLCLEIRHLAFIA